MLKKKFDRTNILIGDLKDLILDVVANKFMHKVISSQNSNGKLLKQKSIFSNNNSSLNSKNSLSVNSKNVLKTNQHTNINFDHRISFVDNGMTSLSDVELNKYIISIEQKRNDSKQSYADYKISTCFYNNFNIFIF